MTNRQILFSVLVAVSVVSSIIATSGSPSVIRVGTEKPSDSKILDSTVLRSVGNGTSSAEPSTLTIEDAIFIPAEEVLGNSTTTSSPENSETTTLEEPEEEEGEEDDEDDDEENPESEDEIIDEATEGSGNYTSTIEPAKMISLGDVPVAAQIDGDVDEETIATVLHFLKEMDENDEVAAAVEGSGDDNGRSQDDQTNQQQPSDSSEEDEEEEAPLMPEEEADDFDTGRDDPYAWENEVPNPDRIPGGPGYYANHNFEEADMDDVILRNSRHGPGDHHVRQLPTRFEMLRHEVLAHGARAPSRLLNDFPVFSQEAPAEGSSQQNKGDNAELRN